MSRLRLDRPDNLNFVLIPNWEHKIIVLQNNKGPIASPCWGIPQRKCNDDWNRRLNDCRQSSNMNKALVISRRRLGASLDGASCLMHYMYWSLTLPARGLGAKPPDTCGLNGPQLHNRLRCQHQAAAGWGMHVAFQSQQDWHILETRRRSVKPTTIGPTSPDFLFKARSRPPRKIGATSARLAPVRIILTKAV